MPQASVSNIGPSSSNGWGNRSNGGAISTSATPAGSTTPAVAVVVAPAVVKPAVNKTLLYVGGALLLWMMFKNKKA